MPVTDTPVLSDVPELWVTVSRPAVGMAWSRLHRASCGTLNRAKPDNVFPEFDGPVSEAWVYYNGTGWDKACQKCCPNLG